MYKIKFLRLGVNISKKYNILLIWFAVDIYILITCTTNTVNHPNSCFYHDIYVLYTTLPAGGNNANVTMEKGTRWNPTRIRIQLYYKARVLLLKHTYIYIDEYILHYTSKNIVQPLFGKLTIIIYSYLN